LSDNVELATKTAKLIHKSYADQLDLFCMGNEPWYFLRDHDQYVKKWKVLRDAVIAGFPSANFCAADEGPMPDLIKKMAASYGNPNGRLVAISQHSYPFGSSYKNNFDPNDLVNRIPYDAAESRAKMLSPNAYKTYEKIYQDISKAIDSTSLPYRFTECNSYSSSGLKGASDSYASALWVADYMYWWANHKADGMNFHTGNKTGGKQSYICRYAAFRSSEKGYNVYPLSYGMKLFDLGSKGRILPTTVAANANQNVVAYSTLSDNNVLFVTIFNKNFGTNAKEEIVEINTDKMFDSSNLQQISLLGRNNDISGTLGDVTLGGKQFKEDGTWNGKWMQIPSSQKSSNKITIKISPASATIIKMNLK
jgi:hypothetical protein